MSNINRKARSVVLALCLPWAALWMVGNERVAAQKLYGERVGNVRDASDAAVAGATVTITNANTNQSRQTLTNEVGAYSFPTTEAGTYTLRVSKEGFSTVSEANV